MHAPQHFGHTPAADKIKFMLGQSTRDCQGTGDVPERIAHHSIEDFCHELADFSLRAKTLNLTRAASFG
jgi:hypothetical protein